jgi:tripartite-type tricarboxylate transporter receptor subunit TctC
MFGLALAIASVPATETLAQTFENKTVEMTIGYAPGGGYDVYGRLAARHIGRHMPGSPVVVPRNMPGAGSITAANFVYTLARKDGTVLGIVTQTIAEEELLGTPGVRYEAAKFSWIGRIAPNIQISITWNTSSVKTIQDAMKHEVPVASNVIAGVLPTVLNHVVGTRFKLINGYAGSADGMLAMEREETDGAMSALDTLKTNKPDWLPTKKVNVIVQYTAERHPELAHVPTMMELAKTPEDRQVLELFSSGSTIGRSLMAPPGVPAEVVKVLRASFQEMIRDPQFLAEVERSRIEFDPLPGEQLQKMIEDISKVSPAIRERARLARGL